MYHRLITALALGFVLSTPAIGEDHELRWEESSDGVLVTERGKKVLYYQRAGLSKDGKHKRANYVHPLFDLEERVLTEDFPNDHRHHRGVFWAWHQMRVGSQVVGDGWAIQDFSWDVQELTLKRRGDGSVRLDSIVKWYSPRWKTGEEALVVETTSIRVYPSDKDRRMIDFDIRMQATNPHTFIGGSDDNKGYGGFSIRIKLPSDIKFTGQNGEVMPTKTAVSSTPWMSMTGALGADQSASGLTVLCHPGSVDYPPTWILRESRSMQNPVWPGREPIELPSKEPVRLRYRIVVHGEPVSPNNVERWQQEYSRQP